MSKVKIQPQNSVIVHIPIFKTYSIDGFDFELALLRAGLKMPMGMQDQMYYYTDAEGWASIILDMIKNSDLYKPSKYKPDIIDCENFALKAMSVVAERYGLNTFGLCEGNTPMGYHGFNIGYQGDGFFLFEPQSDKAEIFGFGDNGYLPEKVLV